jgi:hypothetical protein
VLRFIAHHLWDEAERERNPEHGMPEAVAAALRAEGRLKSDGPHAPATVRRRLAHWSSLHRSRGLEGPFSNPSIRDTLCVAVRAADRPRSRKSVSASRATFWIVCTRPARQGTSKSEKSIHLFPMTY